MKNLFFIALICGASHFTGKTQNTRLGFTAGVAMANYKINMDGDSYHGNSKTGITFGIQADIPAGNHFSFQPAINYVPKGIKDEITEGGFAEKFYISVNAIELPLNFLYNTNGNSGNFFIGAGPSMAFAISGKVKYDDGFDPISEDLKFGNGEEDNMKGMDLGANFLTGYCFPNGLSFSLNYNLGLRNLTNGGSANDTFKSHYFGIKAGWMLSGKNKLFN